jgi:hypothetical protein
MIRIRRLSGEIGSKPAATTRVGTMCATPQQISTAAARYPRIAADDAVALSAVLGHRWRRVDQLDRKPASERRRQRGHGQLQDAMAWRGPGEALDRGGCVERVGNGAGGDQARTPTALDTCPFVSATGAPPGRGTVEPVRYQVNPKISCAASTGTSS